MNREIEIAGKKYPVKFTLRSIKIYEQLCSRNLLKEDYRQIFDISLGVDALTAFVYAGLVGALDKGQQPELAVEDLERELGLSFNAESLIQAYIDFVPGLREIYNKILKDPEFVKKIDEANGDEEKLKLIYRELLESPNGKLQAEIV